jgi:ABC-2 type transport system ATP-binding protein
MQLPVRDKDAVTSQVPTDGNVATLRGVLRELDDAGVDIVDLAIHTPDLDDVFLALTGQHDRSQEPRSEKEPQA